MISVHAAEETHESKVLFSQALEMMSRNNVQSAISNLEEALQIAPDNPAYLSHYGLCVAIDRGEYEAGRRLCERAIRMDPSDPINRVNLGRIYRLEGMNDRAHNTFIKAWRQNKSHPAAASELSRMGIRRRPVIRFLPRSHWLNVRLGMLRAKLERAR